jgi:hypothetical protein
MDYARQWTIGCFCLILSVALSGRSGAEGTRNLLANSSFEGARSQQEAVGWAITRADGTITLDPEVRQHGGFSLGLSDARPMPGAGGDNGFIIIRQTVDAQAGQTYTLSAMMKTENLSDPGGAGIGLINNGWTWEQWATPAVATGDWTRHAITVTLPPSPPYQVILILRPNTTGKVWFDAAQLELGQVGYATKCLVDLSGKPVLKYFT